MFVRTYCITALLAVGLTAVAGATPANTRAWSDGSAPPPRMQNTKTMKVARTKGGAPTMPGQFNGTTVLAMTAFPTGGKGSGTEATCELWGDQLQADEDAVGQATETQDKIDAVNQLNTDIDNALDAGCVVIYSQASPQLSHIKTVAVAVVQTGGYVTTQWTAGTSVAYISAFPTGGKGSGTEATCKLWSDRLQADQERIDRYEAEENPYVQDEQEA